MVIAASVSPASVIHGPAELTIVYVNDAFMRLTGYLADEMIGKSLSLLSTYSAPASALTAMWQGITEERTTSQTWRCVTKQGKELAIELSLVPFMDGSAHRPFLVIAREIASSQPATTFEPGAIDAIQRFIDSLHLSIAVLDRSKIIIALSRQVQRRCRELYNYELVVGQPLAESILQLADEEFDKNFELALQGHRPHTERRATRQDQDALWYKLSYTPLLDESGRVQLVVLTVNDITTNRETEDALALSLQRYALATKNAKAGIWDWDLQANELYIDSSARALLGYDENDFPSNLALWENRIHPDDRDYLLAATQALVMGSTYELRV
jgi:PAS domain S-box-containing protein